MLSPLSRDKGFLFLASDFLIFNLSNSMFRNITASLLLASTIAIAGCSPVAALSCLPTPTTMPATATMTTWENLPTIFSVDGELYSDPYRQWAISARREYYS
jgi:hypothetical protein